MTDSTNPTLRALLRAGVAPAGRRGKFTILAAALVALMAVGPLAGSFEDVQSNEPASFLPGDAQSLTALEQAKRFPSGEILNAVIVLNRDGGLSADDRRAIVALRGDLTRPALTLEVGIGHAHDWIDYRQRLVELRWSSVKRLLDERKPKRWMR